MTKRRKNPAAMTEDKATVEIQRLHQKIVSESREMASRFKREIDECKMELKNRKKGMGR